MNIYFKIPSENIQTKLRRYCPSELSLFGRECEVISYIILRYMCSLPTRVILFGNYKGISFEIPCE